ncbi:MAG: family 78 glycoside hydrolase catalytic domain [Bacteroidota bacterium]|nr:family 78 glycoside hydrolase catalytic domain [Bacteroidota bacterium]
MKKCSLILLVLIVTGSLQAKTKVVNLRCEYMVQPLGIDVPQPRLSWEIQATKSFIQTGYQIRIASREELVREGNCDWISDKVLSKQNVVPYTGDNALLSHHTYYWNVTVWDQNGRSYRSSIARFETAKMKIADWKGRWISDSRDKFYSPAPMFRKSFQVTKTVKQARMYVSGVGYYKLYIDGKKVGNHILDPGYTHYNKRNLYATYDVGPLLKPGENVLSAVLGNGFFNMQSVAVWNFDAAVWRNRPQMIGELHIEYADGQKQVVVTDSSWRTITGPYLYNSLYSGDTYDARLELEGWRLAGFDDSKWLQTQEVSAPAPILESQVMPAICIKKEIHPVSVKVFSKKLYVFDMGENFSGICQICLKGKAGTRITLKHGELIDSTGRVDQSNISIHFHANENRNPQPKIDSNDHFQTDTYILNGKGVETFMPDFTYHGFQYVEVESSEPITLSTKNLCAFFIHSDVTPVGQFSCSNSLLNKIWKATNQSYLSNLESIPTDCPQREKNGWTADAWLSMDAGLLSFDGIKVYEKWVNDMVDNQQQNGAISGIIPSSEWGFGDGFGPVWTSVLFMVPNTLDRYYGDMTAIRKIYPTCERYLKFAGSYEKDGLIDTGLGDWVYYKTTTSTTFTSSCFYYLQNKLMAQFAVKLGRNATPYLNKAIQLKDAINKRFFDPDLAIYDQGSQTAQSTALYVGIVPDGYEQKVAARLCESVKATNHHLDFGMIGSKCVPAMLTKYGYVEDAYQMISQETTPSWGAWIKGRGMTTLPEVWVINPGVVKDASLNHIFLGDVSAWMNNALAGINFDDQNKGFRHIIIHPHFVKDLSWVKGSYRSVNGLIRSEWEKKGNLVLLKVEIPANTTATVIIGKSFEIGSGRHSFAIDLNR